MATNHMLKRVEPQETSGSIDRYDEIVRRIEAATDPGDPENPTGDDVIDADDAWWITQGVVRGGTVRFFVFEPDELRIHVASQSEPGIPATDETPRP